MDACKAGVGVEVCIWRQQTDKAVPSDISLSGGRRTHIRETYWTGHALFLPACFGSRKYTRLKSIDAHSRLAVGSMACLGKHSWFAHHPVEMLTSSNWAGHKYRILLLIVQGLRCLAHALPRSKHSTPDQVALAVECIMKDVDLRLTRGWLTSTLPQTSYNASESLIRNAFMSRCVARIELIGVYYHNPLLRNGSQTRPVECWDGQKKASSFRIPRVNKADHSCFLSEVAIVPLRGASGVVTRH